MSNSAAASPSALPPPPDTAPRALPTPEEMIRHLDRFVHGQQRAKRNLAVAVYAHYLALAYRESPDVRYRDFGKQHVLLFGPTGSGKTYLVKTLAEFLGVPVSFASATSLVQTGYVGTTADGMIGNLLAVANHDVHLAQRGIVFIDEVDKIRCAAASDSRDVSGEGVQNGLLTLLDGRVVDITQNNTTQRVDIGQVLFICTGAFVDLPAIVRRRLGGRAFGYHAHDASHVDASEHDDDWARARVTPEDLREFGFIPEFIGRFPTMTALEGLKKDDLTRILTQTEGSILHRQKLLFELHGVELRFTPEAIDAMAEAALELGTGARGLSRIALDCVDAVDWRLPSLAADGVTRITITPEVVRTAAEPELSRDARPPSRPVAAELRERALLPKPPRPASTVRDAAGNTDTRDWSDDQLTAGIQQLMNEKLGWPQTTGSSLRWWNGFLTEKDGAPAGERSERLRTAHRLCEELARREATITEFFLAYVYSNTDSIQCNLHYLDYTRCKKKWDAQRRKDASSSAHVAPRKDSTTEAD